jgi:hypothetical protein
VQEGGGDVGRSHFWHRFRRFFHSPRDRGDGVFLLRDAGKQSLSDVRSAHDSNRATGMESPASVVSDELVL